jgi:2-polyprenyl-3-methyl-5-hydroxy-6-metoxy-1,4-benzoquinol methylase
LEYWNHNTAYHPMIVGIAEGLHGDVLDVGCGEGLLVERLSRVSRQVTGVDRDEQAIHQAEQRTAAIGNASVAPGDFLTMDVTPASYDLITFVAVIHHMDLRSALRKSSALLRPGGRLIVVGLSANKSPADYMRSAAMLPLIRLLSHLHHETRRIQVVALPPEESFSEIQTIAREELVGCRLRRALYYRYVLQWSKPLH